MKTIFKRAIAFMLSMLMIFGVCNTAIVVYASGTRDSSKPLVYVSIGDSMTNGYGLDGYDGESGVVNYAIDTYANRFAAWLAGYTSQIVDDQIIFEGQNGIVEHRPLAMSGLRAEDINWILNLDYSNNNKALIDTIYEEWYETNRDWTNVVKNKWFGEWGFKVGDFRTWTDFCDGNYRYADAAAKILATYAKPENSSYYQSSYATDEDIQKAIDGLAKTDKIGWQDSKYFPRNEQESRDFVGSKYLQIATEYYQKSVEEADVISVALGNTNFGTYMLTEIMEVVMYNNLNRFTDRYDIEDVYALANYSPEVEEAMRKLVEECSVIVEAQLGSLASGDVAKLKAIKDIVSYCVFSYVVNYVGVIEKIIAANPDVDIIQVALMNAYATETDTDLTKTIGDVVEILYTPINAFIAALPTLMQATGKYSEANFYYAEADNVKCLVDVFGDDFYKNKETGEYIKYNGLLSGGENYDVNVKSTIRSRFIENIVGGMTFDMIQNITPVDRNITIEEIAAYELMTPDQKAMYAATNSRRATSIALYLAFESATIKAGKGNVTLDSLAALNTNLAAIFGGVLRSLQKNATAFGSQHYLSSAAKVVANVEEAKAAGLTYDLLVELYTAMVMAQYVTDAEKNDAINDTLNSVVAKIVNRKMNAELFTAASVQSLCDNVAAARANYAALGAASADEAELGVYFKVIANLIGQGADTIKYLYNNNDAMVKVYVEGLKGIPAGKSALDAGKGVLVGNMQNLCYLLGLPETLSNDMYSDPTLAGIMCMNARILIGTGIGGHPSIDGHTTLFEAMKKSYEEGFTPQDKVISSLRYIITEYYDEIFALVDSFAVKNADLTINKSSSYVAFGDNKDVADAFADHLGINANIDLAIEDTRISNAYDMIAADPSIVADADIISIAYTFDKITEDTFNILFDLLGDPKKTGTSPLETTLDWEELVGADAAIEIQNYIGIMEQELEAQGLNVKPAELIPIVSMWCKGSLTVSECASRAIEYFAYYALEYVVYLPKVVAQIKAINPDALILINAVSNPAAGASFALGDVEFSFGEYLDILADVGYMATAALSIANSNVVLVPTTEVTTSFTGAVLGEAPYGIGVIMKYLLGTKDIEIAHTEEGNGYILAMMKEAVNVKILRGDFNFDGKVTVADSVYLMTVLAKNDADSLNQSADVNGDGKFDKADTSYLLKYILSPSKNPIY